MTSSPFPIIASHDCEVMEHRWVNKRYRYLRLRSAANLAVRTRTGQFYQLRCPSTSTLQPFLLRPMSVYGVQPESGCLEFLYNVTGIGTSALSTLAVGDSMEIVGPLGNSFSFDPSFRRILVVARGVGLATMAPLLSDASRASVGITAVMSARSPDDLMRDEFLRGASADVHTVFDSDRSSSVDRVEALVRMLILAEQPDMVYTCGSQRLLLLLQRVLREHPSIGGEVAMEQRMACGLGVCLSCIRMFQTSAGRQFKRVCCEGPVFPIGEIVEEVELG